MEFDWTIALRYRDALLGGLWTTLRIVLGIIGGTYARHHPLGSVWAMPGLFAPGASRYRRD